MTTLTNVRKAFRELGTHGDKLACRKGVLPRDIYSRLGSSHFQGIQRLSPGRYLAISANSPRAAYLFIVELGSRPPRGRFGSNRLASDTPPAEDRVVHCDIIDTQYTHAGGFQALDGVLAVGVEEGARSKVIFYDVRQPATPIKIQNSEISRDFGPAGAVGLTRLGDGSYLLVVGGTDSAILDFYKSPPNDGLTFNFEHFATWKKEQITGLDRKFGTYQSLNLVSQEDGKLFLIGFHRERGLGGVVDLLGVDWADLFSVTLVGDDRVRVQKLAKKHMYCQDGGNFDAGAGIFVDPKVGLLMYAVDHWPDGNMIKMNEFGDVAISDEKGEAGIVGS